MITFGLCLITFCMFSIAASTSSRPVLLLYGVVGIGSGFAIIFSGFIVPQLNAGFGAQDWRVSWFLLGVQSLAYLLAGSGLGETALFGSVVLYGISVFAIPAIMAVAIGDYLGKARATAAFSIVTVCFAISQTRARLWPGQPQSRPAPSLPATWPRPC